MRLLQIEARNTSEAQCLKRALSSYAQRRQRRRSLWITLPEDQSGKNLADLLGAIETCLTANEIPTVRVNLDGKSYLLEAERLIPPAREEVSAASP